MKTRDGYRTIQRRCEIGKVGHERVGDLMAAARAMPPGTARALELCLSITLQADFVELNAHNLNMERILKGV